MFMIIMIIIIIMINHLEIHYLESFLGVFSVVKIHIRIAQRTTSGVVAEHAHGLDLPDVVEDFVQFVLGHIRPQGPDIQGRRLG